MGLILSNLDLSQKALEKYQAQTEGIQEKNHMIIPTVSKKAFEEV